MRRATIRILLPLAIAVFAAAGCDDNDNTIPTTPTTPAPTVTERFSGTLTRNGSATHSFTTQAAGSITATLTTVNPASPTIGFSMGTWNGTVCTIVMANDLATQGTVLSGTIQTAGSFCLRVSDASGTVDSTAYAIDVVHP